jgi:hypothetical protein
VRHATESDLDEIDDLLDELRQLGALKERKRGLFNHRGRAFLHFHADGDGLYADVRFDGVDFERWRVVTAEEQAVLLREITTHVDDEASS